MHFWQQYHCILLGGKLCRFVPLLVIFIWITWLRQCLLYFSIINLFIFSFIINKCPMWSCINYRNNLFLIPPSPSGFSIHWWFLLELLLWWLPNDGNFSNSIVPSTFITWHSTLRKSFPLIIYLWISIFFNLLLSLFILLLDWLQFGQGSPFKQFLCLSSCPYHSLNPSLLSGTTKCFQLQLVLPLPQAWNESLLQGEWCIETKIWMLDTLIAIVVLLPWGLLSGQS